MSDSLQELFGTLFLGVIAYIVLWIAWRRHFFEKPKQELATTPLSFLHVLAAFAIYFGTAVLFLTSVLTFLKKIFASIGSSESSLYFSVTLQLILSSLIACLLLLFWKTTSPQIAKAIWRSKTKVASYSQDLAIGTLAWVISFPLLLFVNQLLNLFVYFIFHVKELPDQTAIHFLRMTMNHPLSFLFNIISIVILAPFIEELLFRGFLQTYIRKFFHPAGAIALSSICFACFHFSPEQGLSNIPIIGSLFILALFLGYVYERQSSLLASLSLHATFNALSILNLYFLGGTPRWAL
jgi:membrane protease YdiL (CAAX protease family)